MERTYDEISIGTNKERAVAFVEMVSSNRTKLHFEYGPKSSLKLAIWLIRATIECVFRRMFKIH